MTEQKPIDEMSFREAMTELEGIVTLLESNTLELEDSLKNYERGVALLASLQKRLSAADQQVEVLVGELAFHGSDEEQDTTLS
ncbi:exodeoxyribonuclease VII small subunit [Parvibacter caecicola]|uniref:Exodeoxyribonuclease 7 small subunit n=1 Tax=Parvibacter caecicola TaxID=747645 RepID=A0A7W5GPM6_9ACTN|nr:exodeoxyribonuclease VII small subunit [Parvibacter caecicola]MBB3170611.1 exodeoxyribonuclease VII small subunit [Parvibacter caecicola]MCR2041428.1 exodeoxyribonuclease VII small subunit [Parvibacter caecicola]RNL12011.1 exodeoxyribonuclease VII small subunit [Parvibacter caecicola]